MTGFALGCRRAALAWLAGAIVAPALAQEAAPTLTLHYQERPPYSSTGPDGQPQGLVATPARQALAAAGIPHRWVVTPSQRQLALIQSGQGLHCGVGWFMTGERARRGKFSRALYRDQPFGALVRQALPVAERSTAADLLGDARLTLLVKDGYSYGSVLDGLIARLSPRVLRTSVDPPQMSRMLRSGRADWMIVAPEEAGVLGGAGLRPVTLADVPQGPTRHLYCGQDLPDAWLARIDAALAALPR